MHRRWQTARPTVTHPSAASECWRCGRRDSPGQDHSRENYGLAGGVGAGAGPPLGLAGPPAKTAPLPCRCEAGHTRDRQLFKAMVRPLHLTARGARKAAGCCTRGPSLHHCVRCVAVSTGNVRIEVPEVQRPAGRLAGWQPGGRTARRAWSAQQGATCACCCWRVGQASTACGRAEGLPHVLVAGAVPACRMRMRRGRHVAPGTSTAWAGLNCRRHAVSEAHSLTRWCTNKQNRIAPAAGLAGSTLLPAAIDCMALLPVLCSAVAAPPSSWPREVPPNRSTAPGQLSMARQHCTAALQATGHRP